MTYGNEEFKNHLNEVPLAQLNENEVKELKDLEEKLGNNYYLIAFSRKETDKFR